MYKNKTKMARVVKEKTELQISYLPYGHFKFDTDPSAGHLIQRSIDFFIKKLSTAPFLWTLSDFRPPDLDPFFVEFKVSFR